MLKAKKTNRLIHPFAKIIFVTSLLVGALNQANAGLVVNKTINGSPQPAAENDLINYTISVTNTGPGNLNNVIVNDTGVNLNPINLSGDGVPAGAGARRIPTLANGATANVQVSARVNATENCPIIRNGTNVTENSNTFTASDNAPNIEYDFELSSGAGSNVISHDVATSFCEFCDTGEVHITITNPTTTPMTNIVLREDLQALGLSYINGSTTSSIGGASNPAITGGGTVLTWNSSRIGALSSLAAGATLEISFRVSTYTEASIIADASRNIQATVDFDLSCVSARQSLNSGNFELPINQPEPEVIKEGRNVDAGQTGTQYTASTISGNLNDDIIWRVNVRNAGDANLQALRINDSVNTNFSLNFICPNETSADATAASNGVTGGAGCIAMTSPFDVDNPFGNAADPDDISANTTNGYVYYVGRILTNHTNITNSADISWGCEAQSPNGGLITIPAKTNGSLPTFDRDDTQTLETRVSTNPATLNISQTITGSNPAQPLGTKGLVTIFLRNRTSGSLQNIKIEATLPDGYVMDNTHLQVNRFDSRFGPAVSSTATQSISTNLNATPAATASRYPGMINTITRDDPERLTADPLDDINPTFTLSSSTQGANLPEQNNMFRHEDRLSFTFGIIMKKPSYFDKVAELDDEQETVGDNNDPDNALALTNDITVFYDAVNPIGVQGQTRTIRPTYNSNPEDLDVAMSDGLSILTNNTNVPLDLKVLLTNNGGHDADDYNTYVSFGKTISVITPPPACTAISNPPPHPYWNDPNIIPSSASVFACPSSTLGIVAPSETKTLTFTVIKNLSGVAADDLTFRAEVIGEITHFNQENLLTNPALIHPAPVNIASTTPSLQLANNYTLDGVRSKVLGFNLTKSLWYCRESGILEPPPAIAPALPPATPSDLNIQIGEDCNYHIDSGGWFGFKTPGYEIIEVKDITVTDDLPDGQGFIPFNNTNPYIFDNTGGILLTGINAGANTTPLVENDIKWNFNTAGINVRDEFFRVDFKTRLLNDPVDSSAAPNNHSAPIIDIAKTIFTAVFKSDPISGVAQPPIDITVDETTNTPGYPREIDRRVETTVIEPHITVVKEVCNETANGIGIGCSDFKTFVQQGDTDDSYIYKIVLTNEQTNSSVTRASAYNIISTDILDSSDLVKVVAFDNDGLDNDGDGLIDMADSNEGSISDNTINNGNPAQITFSNTHSNALKELAPGASVTFYYRINPDDAVGLNQVLTNTVSMKYDSLKGDFGNQNAPQLNNATVAPDDIGRARIYTTVNAIAKLEIKDVLTDPKKIITLANTPLPTGTPQIVSVGEEIRFELTTKLPVAKIKSFIIRDELPAGMRCSEGQVVNLNAPPHNVAGFSPGGSFTPTCTSTGTNDFIEWNFGDQEVTSSGSTTNPPEPDYIFKIKFIAQIENSNIVNDGDFIVNGGKKLSTDPGTGTVTVAKYIDANGANQVRLIDKVTVVVREPKIELTKSFSSIVPAPLQDAGDEMTVTVTAENTGSATAYNLRVLDDLVDKDMSYVVGSISGTDPPDNVDVSNPKKPIFSWNATNVDYAIAVAATKTFTFKVKVDDSAQPLEILDNKIEAIWNSLPSRNTALNSTGQIGVDGSATGLRNGVLPNATNTPNDYEASATTQTSVPALTVSKTDLNPTVVNAIGEHKNFQIEIKLPEGTTNNVDVKDILNSTAISYVLANNATFDISYTFSNIATINGQPPSESALTSFPADGANNTIQWNIGKVVTNSENDFNATAIAPSIKINYYARINNDTVTDNGDTLQNAVTVTYQNGETPATTETLQDNTAVQTVVEPLLALTKSVTNASNSGAIPVGGNQLEYKVTLVNNGTATAFDVNVVDTIPTSIELNTSFTPTALINGVAVAGFTATPTGANAGPLIWGKGNSDNSLDIPVGQSLVLTYRVTLKGATAANTNIINSVVADWTSLDNSNASNSLERTGAGCPTITAPNDYCIGPVTSTITTAGAPEPLLKENPSNTNATIGQDFSYTITIPETTQATALYDVRILDNLTTSSANLEFVSATKISGSQTWTPTNVGTPTNIILSDAVAGIDIPANQQIKIQLTVKLKDTATNIAGLTFKNTATYTYNQSNGVVTTQSNGGGNTTADMTIVEPKLTMDKRGPATAVRYGVAIPYTLVVENIGTSTAFDTTVLDKLPAVPNVATQTGGTCDTTPNNFNLRITSSADENTVVRALVQGVDYTASYTAAPTCELKIVTSTNLARIESNQKLIASYDVFLNSGSQGGAVLTNIAGATQGFSLDTANNIKTGDIREYTHALTDGTVSVVDEEDAFSITVKSALVDVQKTVLNVTSGQNPATDATPGDTLRYTISVINSDTVDVNKVKLSDAMPANASYVANSTTLNGIAIADGAGATLPLINAIDISSSDLTPPLPTAGNGTLTQGETAVISFDVVLNAVINSGTQISNQAKLSAPATGDLDSDDPNINGNDDPLVIGDEDPTVTTVTSAPKFDVEKVSKDISGDPNVLIAGETLRYTLTVKNIGAENAINSILTDQIPANTTYVANSTTLNGVVVADVANVSALVAGLTINAPSNTTAGAMNANSSASANNVATITFDVVIDNSVIDGTVISNQGFLTGAGAGSGAFAQQPSDDPSTATPDDPTRDVVGNTPLVEVVKTVAIQVDNGSAGILDAGDTIRYTIIANNIGAIDATNVVLKDAIPANTTYVADSVVLNGLPVGQPDGGVSPLVAGIAISSANLTPPLPTVTNGTLSASGIATITFDVVVNAGTVAGTIISNQGFVSNNELPTEASDADGNPANGNQPTLIVVGNVQQLSLTKQVAVVGASTALAGGELEYTVQVTNVGLVPATNVVITDNLDLPTAAQMTYVAGSGLLNGLATGVSVAGNIITADYFTTYGTLAPAGVVTLRFRVKLASNLAIGDKVINTADVRWNTPASTASASVSIDIGGSPGSVNLSGLVWHDVNFDKTANSTENLLSAWTVELVRNNVVLATSTTDSSGKYQFTGLPENNATNPYQIRFSAPNAGVNTASLGEGDSVFTNGSQLVSDIFANAGSNLIDVNLPITPNGVVYDAVLRTVVAGTRLTMINRSRSNQVLPATCLGDKQQNQITSDTGWYKFNLNFSDPARCASGDEYEIQVLPPANGFIGTTSLIIPPSNATIGSTTIGAAQDVPTCPASAQDKIPATAQHCENSTRIVPPPPSVSTTPRLLRPVDSDYYLNFKFDNAVATDQIYNNHIAIDPKLDSALAISKVAGLQNVSRSQLVPYTISLKNNLNVDLANTEVVDNFPAGFKYVAGSSRIDGSEQEPTINGNQMIWQNLTVKASQTLKIKMLLIVGSGVSEGDYINRASARNTLTGGSTSGEAQATVQVIPDPSFDCTDVIGKVFDDKNLNAYQDQGELGIAGVQLATAKGLRVTTDSHGRFNIPCAVVPNELRGSNFIIKLDDRSLPSGYRITTENPRVLRATRGKMLKFNFGATIHRVVRLDLAAGVFEKNSTKLRVQWKPRIKVLMDELKKESAILRLSYLAENETQDLVDSRLATIKQLIEHHWETLDCCYRLSIETEVFWRSGKPKNRMRFK